MLVRCTEQCIGILVLGIMIQFQDHSGCGKTKMKVEFCGQVLSKLNLILRMLHFAYCHLQARMNEENLHRQEESVKKQEALRRCEFFNFLAQPVVEA